MSTSSLLNTLFQYKMWADNELLCAMAHLEIDGAERHTATRIMNHVHVVDNIFMAHLQQVSHPYGATNTSETPTLADLEAAMAKTHGWYLGYLQTLTTEQGAEPLAFNFTDGGQGTMTREEMLLHVINHGSYHRGAVGRLLAQQDLTPPADTLTRYLHLSEPARRQGT